MKFTKKESKVVEKLDNEIEELELADMSETEIEKTVTAFSEEGMQLRAARKKIRYQLYRLRTEQEGKCAAESTDEFKKQFEDQEFFDGWNNFGTTWDVAFDEPTRIVHRTLSEQEEWDELVKAKFPTVTHDGKVKYPDINVRKKVEAEAAKRAASAVTEEE